MITGQGRIVTEPGYHAESRLWLRPAPGLEDVRVPETVEHVDEMLAARDYLMVELLGDFAWADAASKANALGLLLPFVRDLIDGRRRCTIVAPDVGTDKTYLAQAALLPAMGPIALEAAGSRPRSTARVQAVDRGHLVGG